MKSNESMDSFENRVLGITTSLTSLGKELSFKEINLKVVHALSGKRKTMKEFCFTTKDLGAISPEILFSDFKAF